MSQDADDYQRRTAKFDNHWPGAKPRAYVLGLCAEAGEVANEFERADRIGARYPVPGDVALELGDVLWNVARLADHYGFKLTEIMEMNLEKLEARHG